MNNEEKAKEMCFKVCKTGAYIDSENGCFDRCGDASECTTWRSYAHKVPDELERTKPKANNAKIGARALGRKAGIAPSTASRIIQGEGNAQLGTIKKALPFLDSCPCCGKGQPQ